MARIATLGPSSAARILHLSPQLVHYRARAGKIRCVRKNPLRFRFVDIVAYAATMPPVLPRRPRRTELETVVQGVLHG